MGTSSSMSQLSLRFRQWPGRLKVKQLLDRHQVPPTPAEALGLQKICCERAPFRAAFWCAPLDLHIACCTHNMATNCYRYVPGDADSASMLRVARMVCMSSQASQRFTEV